MKWNEPCCRDKKSPKYKQIQRQRERIPRINKPNQTNPNRSVYIHFGGRGCSVGGGGYSLSQLLLLYYLNFLHTFLPLFSFSFFFMLRVSFSFYLTRCLAFFPHLNVLFLFQLWHNESSSFVIWSLCMCCLPAAMVARFRYEQPSALTVCHTLFIHNLKTE